MIINWEEIQSNRSDYMLIDVRSPGEFKEATIPGAINLPLFTDQERAEVGTIYKQVGPDDAKIRGLEIVSPKLVYLMREIRKHRDGRQIVIFCWRGGMRSKSVVMLSDWMGVKVHQLKGGYRAYRQYISKELQKVEWETRFIVLHGHTGVGKTILLNRLEELGYPVLNLEQMADHRGSIFGRIGLTGRHSQKMFDSLLWENVIKNKEKPYLFVEAESKRIGHVFLPKFVLDKKENGIHVLIEASLCKQVERIIQEYTQATDDTEPFKEAFSKIEKRLTGEVASEIRKALDQNDLRKAVEMLMIHYYQPRYSHARDRYAQTVKKIINADHLESAVSELEKLYHGLVKNNSTVSSVH